VWDEGYVEAGGTRFHVRSLGEGPNLALLLHGWPEDGSAWRRVAPLLAEGGFRVACPDLKGLGQSDAPRKGYDPRTLGDELSRLIRGLGAKKALVVGHDWGGAVALAGSFRHPGHVLGLVLISFPYRDIDLRAAWHVPLFNIPWLPEAAFRFASRPLIRAAMRHITSVREAIDDEAVEIYAASVRRNPRAWLAYYRTLSRAAVKEQASSALRRVTPFGKKHERHQLRVPALVIWGEEDPATPVKLGEGTARDLDAELVRLAGVGHCPPEEDPLAVARAILAFARPLVSVRSIATSA